MIKKIFKYVLILVVVFIIIAVVSGDKKEDEKVVEKTPITRESQINIAGWPDSPFITLDGQELYYMYSRYNFFPAFAGEMPTLEMPKMAGHHPNDINPYDDSDIYVSKRNADGSWGKPENLAFNDSRGGCCAMVVKGPPFTIYYQTEYEGAGADLVYRERDASGKWGREINMGTNVNSKYNDFNQHVSEDQNEMWFASDSGRGGLGGDDIWYTKKVSGVWSKAVNVGAPVNTEGGEDQMWVSSTDGTAYFNRESSIYQSKWNGTTFSEPKLVKLGMDFVGEASLTANGSEIFFASTDPKTKTIKLYSAKKKGNGWAKPQLVD